MPEPVAERTTASDAPGSPMLSVRGLNAWYGESHILHGVSFDVREGEVVTLLGRNGAGKTTTLRTIMGLWRARTGAIVFRHHDITTLETVDREAERVVVFATLEVRAR